MKYYYKRYTHWSVVPVMLFLSVTVGFGQTSQNHRETDYRADQVLKSNAKVNPSTLALEFSIPIGGYTGRAGHGLPIIFNYSSKVWQIYSPPGSSWQEQYGTIINDTKPLYAERSAAGWTSSLRPPRIDYTLTIYQEAYSGEGYFNYDGQSWAPYISYGQNPPPQPNFDLFYMKRVQVTMPDGSSHEFRKDDTAYSYGTSISPGGTGLPDLTGTFLSVDGSRMKLELSEQSSTLYLSDGSRYLFGAKTGEHVASTYIDANGNKMSYDAANRRWTDTLGRIIEDPMPSNWHEFEQNQTVGDVQAEFAGIGSTTFDVTFSWRYLKDPQGGESGLENTSQDLHYTSNKYCQGDLEYNVPGSYLFNNPEISITRVCAPGYSSADPPFNPIVLTKITLPNGQFYEFKYNVYGEVSKIVYPTGAYERFQYGYVAPIQLTEFSYSQANRGVISRWVSEKGDGTDELQSTYSGTKNYQEPYTVTTTAPDGTKTVQYLYDAYTGNEQPYGFGDAKSGRAYEELLISPSPGNQLLRRNLTKYTTSGPLTGGVQYATRDLRPEKEISIIFEPGSSYALASMSETVYDTTGSSDPAYFSSLNPKQSKTYDYVVVSAMTAESANIATAEAWFSSSTPSVVTEMDYLYDANYKARNINGLVTETRIKDASGNIKAKSQVFYDEPTYPIISAGTHTQWEDPQTSYRGNPTTTRSWHDIAGDLYVETHAQYDNFGNLRKAWDANGNLTQTDFSSTYGYAYPTSTTTPVPDSTGTHGSNTAFTSTTTYDYNTGLPLTSTDINGQTSTMEYNDPLLRPTKTTAPNGHQTITEYGAGTSAATRWVKTKSQIDETNWKEAITWFDGLGRNALSQQVDNEQDDVFVVTCYDDMGRVLKSSNPVRSSTAPTCASSLEWTTPAYDDLGRNISVTTPDSAVMTTAYGLATAGSEIGTVVTVTDQAGKLRRSVTNALGQLKRVDEPDGSNALGTISSPNQPTLYSYDLLNNLTAVQQDGDTTDECGGASTCTQTRTFAYDALSRLKQAVNPESGTINYTYDNNGNLATKVDARTITTAYTYDALNRVTERAYTNEPSGSETPDVTYTYDDPLIANSKGRLTKISSSISEMRYASFDILGRVLSSQQITDGQTYSSAYTYNLSGALIEQTYPSGRIVKNVLDNNGDLSIVQSKKSANHGFWNYAQHFTFNAAGAVTSLQLGNNRWESTQFNSRLQPTQIALGTVQNGTDQLDLDFGYGTIANNGNVTSQTITVPTVGSYTGFTATQTYTYDSLNRIKDATENITGQTPPSWKQTFTYDRYGNRSFDEANTTQPASFADPDVTNPTISTTNNRFSSGQGYSYDSAGNTTQDALGRTFIYDAENKQIEVIENSVTIGEYFYDGDGKRVKKVSANETVIFVYDAAGKLVAEYANQISQTPKVSYLTSDHLGSPRINTDENGDVIARHDYHPFGEEIIGIGGRTTDLGYAADDVRKQFTGYERDNESTLDFAEARYYNFNHGRFTSSDDFFNDTHVSQPQSWNLYAYVRNSPLVFVDPTGMMTDFIDFGTGNRVHIDDGKDQVIAATSADIAQFQKEINSDRAAYDERLRAFENSANNLNMTTAQFNDLAGIIYAEASNNAPWQEAAGIHGVLRNRATADGNTVLDQANDTSQVFGANDKSKAFSPNASQAKLNAVYKGIAVSVVAFNVNGSDLSNGAYFWHGTDFKGPTKGSKAHERFYKTGFHFTSPSHDIWKLGDRKSGNKKFDFKYESTAAFGKTTFMKLTQAWMKANGATRWNGK